MNIRRCGSYKIHGWTQILNHNEPEVEWDGMAKSVKLSVGYVSDRNSESTYHYEVFLSIDDIQKIIETLANKGIDDSQDEIAQKFATKLDKLLKIMVCSIGIAASGEKGDTNKAV